MNRNPLYKDMNIHLILDENIDTLIFFLSGNCIHIISKL